MLQWTITVMLCIIAVPSWSASKSKDDLILQYLEEGRKTKDNMEAMRLFIAAEGEAKQDGKDSLLFWAHYEIGRIYYSMLATGEALEHFTQAYELCTSAQLGPKAEMYVLNGIAAIYDENGDYSKAFPIAQKSLRLALKEKDTLAMMTYYANIASTAEKLHDYTTAEQMLDAADSLAYDNKDAMYKDLVRCQLLYAQKRYDECLALAPIVLESKKLAEFEKAMLMSTLVEIYIQRKQYEQAAEMAHKAVAISTLSNKWKFYDFLSKIYQCEGKYAEALQCSDSASLFKDSLINTNNKQLERANQFKLDAMMLKSDYENQLQQYRQNFQKGIIIILFIIFAIVVVGYNRYQKHKQNKKLMDLQMEDAKNKKMLAEQKMHETEVVAEYQKNILQQKISQKRRELEMNTMFISSRNALIEELITSISKIEEIAENRELKNIIKTTRQTLGYANNHDEFLAKFQEANPEFVSTLRENYPQLTGSDIRFLIYVKMDYPTKEIASMLNISPASCKQKKTRIAKKLELENATELRNFVQHI